MFINVAQGCLRESAGGEGVSDRGEIAREVGCEDFVTVEGASEDGTSIFEAFLEKGSKLGGSVSIRALVNAKVFVCRRERKDGDPLGKFCLAVGDRDVNRDIKVWC